MLVAQKTAAAAVKRSHYGHGLHELNNRRADLLARLMITLGQIFRTLAGEHENNRAKRQYPQRRDSQSPIQPEQDNDSRQRHDDRAGVERRAVSHKNM